MSEGSAVRTLLARPRPARRLVALPHSGGRAEAFNQWRDTFAETFADELCAIQYPGHGDRLAQPSYDDVPALASEIVDNLLRLSDAEVVLFGHSFGSAVACEVAAGLERSGVEVSLLVASAAWAPGDPARDPHHDHLLPDDRLWARVTELGGIDPLVAEDPDLLELLVPPLRADITAHERYLAGPAPPPLRCDVHVYLAEDDPLVPTVAGHGWRRITAGAVTQTIRPGTHFHLFDEPMSLLQDLRVRIDGARVGARPA